MTVTQALSDDEGGGRVLADETERAAERGRVALGEVGREVHGDALLDAETGEGFLDNGSFDDGVAFDALLGEQGRDHRRERLAASGRALRL